MKPLLPLSLPPCYYAPGVEVGQSLGSEASCGKGSRQPTASTCPGYVTRNYTSRPELNADLHLRCLMRLKKREVKKWGRGCGNKWIRRSRGRGGNGVYEV